MRFEWSHFEGVTMNGARSHETKIYDILKHVSGSDKIQARGHCTKSLKLNTREGYVVAIKVLPVSHTLDLFLSISLQFGQIMLLIARGPTPLMGFKAIGYVN